MLDNIQLKLLLQTHITIYIRNLILRMIEKLKFVCFDQNGQNKDIHCDAHYLLITHCIQLTPGLFVLRLTQLSQPCELRIITKYDFCLYIYVYSHLSFWIVLRHQICRISKNILYCKAYYVFCGTHIIESITIDLARPISYEHLSFQVICLD